MVEESTTDIALYATVDETNKKRVLSPEIQKNYDENDYSNMESEYTELRATRKEETQPTYTVLQRDETSQAELSKTLPSFNCFGDKHKNWETAGSISQVWLCLVIMIFTIAILVLAFGISAGVFYTMICRLRAEISSNKSEALEVSLNEELVSSLRYEIDLLHNKTYNNSYQLSSSNFFELVNQLNKSAIINYESSFSLIAGLNDSSSNLLELVSKLNMSTTLNYALLEKRINIIENATSGRSRFDPAYSCQAIHMFQPSSTSGYYWAVSSNGSSVRIYCDMTKSCGTVTGGLTRVAILNNETRPQLCIDDFSTTNENTRCVRSTEDAGCSNIIFPVMNISYSHICGTVQAFWFGFPDGFAGSDRSSTTINDNYVDGISLTYGTSNKTHIWTFIADVVLSNQNSPGQVPGYVGDYYSWLSYVSLCTSNASSCYSPFFRLLQQPVTEDIELRLCQDQHRVAGTGSEGMFLENLEIYVW